jgi:hypothetical protein
MRNGPDSFLGVVFVGEAEGRVLLEPEQTRTRLMDHPDCDQHEHSNEQLNALELRGRLHLDANRIRSLRRSAS